MARKCKIIRASYGYDELLDYIETAPRNWEQDASVTNTASEEWDLSAGYDGALELARFGWSAGREQLLDATGAANKSWSNCGVELVHDVVGAAPDVGAYLTGDPYNMLNLDDEVPAPVVSIAVPVAMAYYVNARSFVNAGAGILSACQALEAAGYSVELRAYMGAVSRDKTTALLNEITLKRAGGVIDYDAVAFALTHPAMCRRIEFAWSETLPADIESKFENYGQAPNFEKLLDEASVSADIVLPTVEEVLTPTDGLRRVVEASNGLLDDIV